MNASQLETRLEERFTGELGNMGYDLRDVEWVREHNDWYLRFFITKPGGIELTDCEQVSRYVDDILDREFSFGDEGYILEVSSPGLEAPLKKPKHWEEAINQYIELKLYQKLNGEKVFKGMLKEHTDETVVLEIEGQGVEFDRILIAKANLAVNFDEIIRRKS